METPRVPDSLRDEIIEIYSTAKGRPSKEILVALNAPFRVQERGFVVDATHLLGVIIDCYEVTPRTRFGLYDRGDDSVMATPAYPDAKAAAMDTGDWADVCVFRFEVP